MKIQKIITSNNNHQFESLTNEYLNDGWSIVVGTLQCTIQSLAMESKSNFSTSKEIYMVVVEKDK